MEDYQPLFARGEAYVTEARLNWAVRMLMLVIDGQSLADQGKKARIKTIVRRLDGRLKTIKDHLDNGDLAMGDGNDGIRQMLANIGIGLSDGIAN